MNARTASLTLLLPLLLACDEKKETPTAPSASASATMTAPVVSASASAAPAPSASAAPSAAPSASSSMLTGDAKDVVLTMKDPTKEPEKTIKATAGGSVTLFLPDYPGTVWSVDVADKALGKAKEEVIPGFAPQTNGHQFKWATTSLKAGQKVKATFVNKKLGDKAAKPSASFTLVLEIG